MQMYCQKHVLRHIDDVHMQKRETTSMVTSVLLDMVVLEYGRLHLEFLFHLMAMPLMQVVKVFERILYAADEKEAKEAMEQVLEEYNQQPRAA